jgi:S-(hydroxymethyl)glutathione dehydrogenase/alcohol dehydrogenase
MAAVDAACETVIAVDVEASKLKLAAELGATEATSPEALLDLVSSMPSRGPDHVFECVGLPETAELALRAVRPGGTVTFVGMTAMGATAAVDVYRFVEDGKRLLGSNYGSSIPARDFPRIADDAVAGRLPLERLISETIGLERLDAAFEAMRRRDGARRIVRFDPPAR